MDINKKLLLQYAESSSIGTALDDAREQLMFDRLLSGMSIMGSLVPLCPVTRGFPQRRRLDPLMEDVEEDSSDSTSVDNSEATKSYSTDQVIGFGSFHMIWCEGDSRFLHLE